MTCENPLELASSILDGRLPEAEREAAMAHVLACGTCSPVFRSLRGVREGVKSLAVVKAPADLSTQLAVIASRERARRLRRDTPAVSVFHWSSRLALAIDNLARPMALPVAGGLLSALLLFGAVLQQAFPAHFRNDVPTMMFTDPDGQVVDWTIDNKHYYQSGQDAPRLESINAIIDGDDTVVSLIIDPTGHVADYSVLRGELPSEAKSLFLLSRFTPATLFGQPTWGKMLMLFRHSDRSAG
jgi:hypothetical protein